MAKTVLVTGASRGLGREIAKLFAQNNYNVVINYNNSLKEAECLKEELEHLYHVKTLLVKCNIANEEEVKNMIAKIKSEFSTIDVLVNNAGIALDNSLEEKTSLEFQSVLNTNVIGTFLVTKYSLEILKKGAIINIASTDGIDTGYIEGIDYNASKAGVISLTHDFASVCSPDIRVNCVSPGWINTDMTSNLNPEFRKAETQKILLNRFAEPKEVAEVVLFLASSKASYINNTVIRVDGGYHEFR